MAGIDDMHFDAPGIISLYGELAFGIVCTFWIIHEVKQLFKRP
jgi:hypothetical protein